MTDDRRFMSPSYGELTQKVSTLEAQVERWQALARGLARELAEALPCPPVGDWTSVETKVLRAEVPEVPVTPAREV